MDDQELEHLLLDLESDRVERKASLSDPGRIRQAICAFANDLPNHQKPGVVFLGANDDGSCANLRITDELLRTLADMRSDGNILPFPVMTVQKRTLNGCEMAVVEVHPSDDPPVRYRGVVWIRVGPRRARATREEESLLCEKRRSRDLPYDLRPLAAAGIDDLDHELFVRTYLPAALPADVLEQNDRSVEDQLTSLRFAASREPRVPTMLGVLVLGKTPTDLIPGAYVQFLHIDGAELTDPIRDQQELHGPLPDVLRRLDDLMRANIATALDVTSGPVEVRLPDYPIAALQQLLRNAVMHRDYETSSAPVRVTWYRDRIEIQNPGGPYGQVTVENFGTPGITDYRNPHLAEAMKNLGYVQRFGIGIELARKELQRNGNPPPQFQVETNYVLAVVRSRP